jgi:hypothetical protein
MKNLICLSVIVLFLLIHAVPALSGEADVIHVALTKNSDNTYDFDVTVEHTDKGLEHYVTWWRIRTPEGKEIDRRRLVHPHVNEQPFTRSLGGVNIPKNINIFVVEAFDRIHGYGGKVIIIDLRVNKGQGYRIL